MRRTREQWAALVDAFEKSNQSVTQFCAKRGIVPKTFAWWRWQLRDTAPPRSNGVKLLSVDVVENATAPSSEIVIAISDVELRVDVGADIEYVAALVERLRRA
jgi:hypothetical protein